VVHQPTSLQIISILSNRMGSTHFFTGNAPHFFSPTAPGCLFLGSNARPSMPLLFPGPDTARHMHPAFIRHRVSKFIASVSIILHKLPSSFSFFIIPYIAAPLLIAQLFCDVDTAPSNPPRIHIFTTRPLYPLASILCDSRPPRPIQSPLLTWP